jgi:excisionase family DNA binding protein
MAKGKNVLTTGDVAKICNVAPRTVSKWFDSGQLRGYRIPGSKDRRIPVNELLRFMKAHDMPTDALAVGKIRVLLVGQEDHMHQDLPEQLAKKGGYEVHVARSTFDAGAAVQRFTPHVVLVNLLAKDVDAQDVCRSIRTSEDFETIKVVALANHLSNQEEVALLQKGFDAYVSDPSDPAEIAKRIEETTAIIY